MVARYDLRPRKSLLGGPWNTIATRGQGQGGGRGGGGEAQPLGVKSAPRHRFCIFATAPNPVADIHHASALRCLARVVAQVQREYIPLGEEGLTADPVAAAGSCGWLVVHVCTG